MIKRILAIILSIITIFSLFTISVSAEETKGEYRLGELYNTGKDNGYSKRNSIGKDDPHYNWSMGDFFVTGFTRQVLDGDTPVFLKNAGDKVTLWFDLQQDIKALNENKNLYVCEDTNGYEETYKVAKQNLKKEHLLLNIPTTKIKTVYLKHISTSFLLKFQKMQIQKSYFAKKATMKFLCYMKLKMIISCSLIHIIIIG